MPEARKAQLPLLLGSLLLLALVAALGLLAWDEDSRSPDVELVSRTGTQARTGAADGGVPEELQRGGSRVAGEVSDRALAHEAALAARALAGRRQALHQLTGEVLGPAGQPIAGARVLATTRRSEGALGMELTGSDRAQVASAETDTSGWFGVPAGEEEPELAEGRQVSALVRAPGWAVRSVRFGRFPSRPPMEVGAVRMEPGLVVAGRVLGPEGLPAEGATVYFGQSRPLGGLRVSSPSRGYLLGTTDADGAFRCDELEPGPFHLVVEKPGHPVARYEGEVSAGRGLAGVVVRLERGGAIGGVVDGGPLSPADLWVSLWPADDDAPDVAFRSLAVRPGADGRFLAEGLRPSVRYLLTVSPAERPRRAMEGEYAEARCGETGVELVYRPRSTIRGRVVHRPVAGGEAVPVERFVIGQRRGSPPADEDFIARTLEGEDGEALTAHPGGRFAFEGLRIESGERESYTLRVRAPGFEQLVTRSVLAGHGEDVDLGDLELTASPALTVRVVEGRSTLPVAGARVFLAPSSSRDALGWWRSRGGSPAHSSSVVRYGETDELGAAELQRPRERPWSLFVDADGFPSGELLSLTGAEDEVTVRITRGATVTAEVVDGAGEPLAGVDVDLQLTRRGEPEGSIPQRVVRSDERGIARFENVGAGRATLRAASPRMRPQQPRAWREAARSVDVPEEGAVVVRLESQLCGVLRGRVRVSGTPLSDARLRLAVRQGKQLLRPDVTSTALRAITGPDGRFELRGVPAGRYEVTVNHPSRGLAAVFTHEVRPEAEELLIDLTDAAVEGRLVWSGSGAAAGGVTIRVQGPSDLHRAWVGERSLREELDGDLDATDRWLEPGRLRSDADGRFRIGGLSAGVPVRLEISGDLVVRKRVRLEPFEDGEVRDQLVIEVEPAAALTVAAGASRGRSQRSRGIRLSGLDGTGGASSRTTVTRVRRGRHRFEGLRPGRYRVEVIDLKAEGAPVLESEEVTLAAGERATVTMAGL